MTEKLKTLKLENLIRMKQENFYKKNLKNIKQISFLLRKFYSVLTSYFLILVNNRDRLKKYLFRNNIETNIHYPIIPLDQKCYSKDYKN